MVEALQKTFVTTWLVVGVTLGFTILWIIADTFIGELGKQDKDDR